MGAGNFTTLCLLGSVMYGNEESPKTTLSFLPPIRHPITEYSTVHECILRSQSLALRSNMKYVHIMTVDTGAAAKFFRVIWNYPEKFNSAIVNLVDFARYG